MTAPPARTCPICTRAEPSVEHAPFCSRRCADVDLQRWFSGRYVLPGEGEPPRDDDRDEG